MQKTETTHSATTLLMAIEMSNAKWLTKSTDLKAYRVKTVDAGDIRGLELEMARAKKKFKAATATRIYVCYEAGRDGFWLARHLMTLGYTVYVVDPASIEVPQRHHRIKTDRIDVGKLLDILKRYVVYGEQKAWRVCRIPSEEQEDEARLSREHERLKMERGALVNRTRSLLVLHGIRVVSVRPDLDVGALRTPRGEALKPQLQREISRELRRLALVNEQMEELKQQRRSCIKIPKTTADHKAAKLNRLYSLGEVTSTALARDFFWRTFRNRREVGAMAGLCGSPYNSGDSRREQGITKTGNARIRTLMIETAWLWVRLQPQSELTQWFHQRQSGGNKRGKRVLIVALARKLLIAFWKYLETGEVPKGARLKVA